MKTESSTTIGLIIRSVAYQKRSARSQLDVALVIAALEIPLRLYFLGPAIMQLIEKRALLDAQLPAGYRAWASLPDLTDVAVFAEPAWHQKMQESSLALVLEAQPMSISLMRSDWQSCNRTIML
jgi:sulfur relay (sulfurtransferase) DsrF/TusC family protein